MNWRKSKNMATKLDFTGIAEKDSPKGKFPVKVKTEYRVHFSADAYDQMKRHAGTTDEVEICGVLAGEVMRDDQGPFLLIHAAIEGQNSNNYGAQVTFTHQTWEHINKQMDEKYAKYRIVGWYHTHPGFGVFLSKMDMFIQENTFNHPFQVAIVIETKKKQEGCFAWVNGGCEPLKRYWVDGDEISLTTGNVNEFTEADMMGRASAPEQAAPARVLEDGPPPRLGVSFLSLVVMILLFFCGLLFGKMQMARELHAAMKESLDAEIYSIVETAGLSALAKNDLGGIRSKVEGIEGKMQKGDSAGAMESMKAIREELKSFEDTYAKYGKTYRGNMERLLTSRLTLSGRVEMLSQQQKMEQEFIAGLYFLQLQQILVAEGQPVEPDAFSDTELRKLKQQIEFLVRLSPSVKEQILAVNPKVMEKLFPSVAPAESSEKTMDDKTASGKAD